MDDTLPCDTTATDRRFGPLGLGRRRCLGSAQGDDVTKRPSRGRYIIVAVRQEVLGVSGSDRRGWNR